MAHYRHSNLEIESGHSAAHPTFSPHPYPTAHEFSPTDLTDKAIGSPLPQRSSSPLQCFKDTPQPQERPAPACDSIRHAIDTTIQFQHQPNIASWIESISGSSEPSSKRRRTSPAGSDTQFPLYDMSSGTSMYGSHLNQNVASQSPSNITPKSQPAPTERYDLINKKMVGNGILYEDNFWNSVHCVDFKAHVKIIVDPERSSVPGPRSVQRWMNERPYYSSQNESTYFNWFLPQIIKRTFTPSAEQANIIDRMKEYDPFVDAGPLQAPAMETNESPDIVERFDIGMGRQQDKLFARGFQPNTFQGYEELMAKYMPKGKGFTTPKPDAVLGFRDGFLPLPERNLQLSDHILNILNICPGLEHPYNLKEGKSKDGNEHDLELQARNGGATLVHCNRELHQYAYNTTLSEPGPDYRTFIFSTTTTAAVHSIHVNFAVVYPDGTIQYHMNTVKRILLDDENALTVGRRYEDNISDWGLLGRRDYLIDLRKHLYAREKERISMEIQFEADKAKAAAEARIAAKAAKAGKSSKNNTE